MTNSYRLSYESKETFTEIQIKEISDAISKAVEDAMSEQLNHMAIEGKERGQDGRA